MHCRACCQRCSCNASVLCILSAMQLPSLGNAANTDADSLLLDFTKTLKGSSVPIRVWNVYQYLPAVRHCLEPVDALQPTG